MHYFFLEKQSNLTLRWKVRQVAFDAKYRYLYYSKPLSRSDIEEVMTRSHDIEGSGYGGPSSSAAGTSSRKVQWSGKVKVTQLRYAADEYIVPPSSEDFNEGVLLTLIVIGHERSLEKRPRRSTVASRSVGSSSENSFSHRSSASWFRSTSRLSSVRHDSGPDSDGDHNTAAGAAASSSASQPLLGGGDAEVPEPEPPSGFIHLPSYPVNESLDEDFEDEDENMFRDIDLVPDDEEDEETSVAASEADSQASEEEGDDDDDDVALNSPPSSPTESARSGYSFFSRRHRTAGRGIGTNAREEKTVQLQFRAANYDVFRIVSLRVRQALVRHGLCGPLHAGLPPYDPRNGIALATVPLHLRHAFRRLNDVVFYSLQIGHVVYVRQQREVRGMEGYLCITHDSILLLQLDGKCPRWLDLEDIVGVQYVLRGSHSFISVRAAEPYPDFVFLPIIPSYPPNSTFDSEECVEGIVSMVRRLLMQRLRAGEEVALAPVSSRRASVHTAEDTDEYDILCHIHDLSAQYTDVFKYIAQEQSTGATPLRWRWDNSKTPTHFTFKRDLFHALEREEGEDSEEDETSPSRLQRRPFTSTASAAAAHGHMGEAVVPLRQPQSLHPASASSSSRWPGRNAKSLSVLSGSSHNSSSRAYHPEKPSRQSSLLSNASFLPATMTQLMAPPSRGAELRAMQRLQVTRTDRRSAAAAASAAGGAAAAVAADAAGEGEALRESTLPSSSKPTFTTSSMGTIPRTRQTAEGPRVHVTAVPPTVSSPHRRGGGAATPPPPPQGSAVLRGAGAPSTGGQRTPEPQAGADCEAGTAQDWSGSAAAAGAALGSVPLQRPPSSRPNTYGLVPAPQHADPAGLDHWFSPAAPNVPPVVAAQKGVQLSAIQQQQQQQSTTATSTTTTMGAGRDATALTTSASSAHRTVSAGAAPLSSSAAAPSTAAASSSSNAAAGAAAVTALSAGAMTNAAPTSGAERRVASSSAGPRGSATNGSRSPQEVTHTTENVSEGDSAEEEDEESDEDFDSEDMEAMLQRPETRGLTPAHEEGGGAAVGEAGAVSVAAPAAAPVAAPPHAAVAAPAAALSSHGASVGTPGAGTVPAESPGFVQVGDGVVTPAVLTADLLPGFRPRDAIGGHHSETASAPSPSLQARPDMVAFIPPAVLPK